MEDNQILDLFFARDESAIDHVADKYGSQLLRLSQNLLGSEDDARECLNDTYLAAWDRIPPARPACFYAWLCRVIRNLSCDRLDRDRAAKRSASIISLTQELEQVLTVPAPGETGELSQSIDRFLRRQDKLSRQLFLRRYFYADSLTELARMTGMRENTVAARLVRLRRRLRKHLIEEGFNP